MVVELRRTLNGCAFWSDYVVADSGEEFQDKIQDLREVVSALLSWVLAKTVSTNAIQRAATSSTQKTRNENRGSTNFQ